MLTLFLAALVILLSHQPGFAEDQDIEQLHKAAEQGDSEAQFSLGAMYSLGRGIPEDDVEAYAWMILATAQGNKEAVKGKNVLRPKLTAEQVAEAQKLAAELFERIESAKLD